MASGSLPRMISHAEVVGALGYSDLIPAVERGLGSFSKRTAADGSERGVFPQRVLMSIKQHDGSMFVMPVYSSADDIIATKMVTNYPKNGERYNIASHMSTIILHDATNGKIKAVMDGDHVTGMRTAAASAVATKYLAKTDSKVLAILGAGVQAESHVHALKHILKLDEIRVWTRSFEKAQAFAEKFDIKACKTAEEAARDADVIVTCTLSASPVLKASWLKRGVHINCVGACVPWAQELGSEVMRKAVVYTDNTPGALQESGDIIHSKVDIYGEIGDVINGTVEAKKDETTVFKSQGVAIEDAVAARLIYNSVMSKQ